MGLLMEFLFEAFTNPQRRGCPDDSELEALSRGILPHDHAAYRHIGSCSECFAEYRYMQSVIRSASKLAIDPSLSLSNWNVSSGAAEHVSTPFQGASESKGAEKPRFISAECWNRANYYTCTRKALDYIRTSLGHKITLTDVASAACMERTAFSKRFKQQTGCNVHEFVQTYLISRAAEQMEVADYSITEIALNLGFSNLETFERAFRKIAKCTPSSYRKTVVQERALR